ncbi:MAG TPA: regulatory iron-sulfur-containing complex subunit RicT [Bellilinea sp.]|nr:regulatory iron-sulfur-containing complex subunit RicT [Bellilinea sp.]
MSLTVLQNVVGVRFSKVGKIYHFDASSLGDVKTGDSVVVETARGWQLGEIAQLVDPTMSKSEGGLKSISRLATPRDLLLRKVWQVRELDVVEAARKRVEELRLYNVKIVSAEYSFDGSRLAIMYSTDSEEKVDLKSLRSDMQKIYAPTQVEMRQIGPRDVAKIIGGMGACGLEKRCCSAFLTDFSSISIRMAKEQGISLSPTEITGMCGRLRCCLIYEYDTYTELRKGLPKRGKHITTPVGEGKVVDVSPLQGTVRVEIPELGIREFTKAELSGEPEAAAASVLDGDADDREGEVRPTPPTAPARPQPRPGEPPAIPGESRPSGLPHHEDRQGRRKRGGRRH